MAAVVLATCASAQQVDIVSRIEPAQTGSFKAAGDSFALSMTPDGAFVLFASAGQGLVTNRYPGAFLNVFLRCRTNGTAWLVSANTQGTAGGNGNSGYASVTPDGRYVVFQSDASDVVTNDTNQASDIFVRDVVAGTTVLASVNVTGTASGNGASLCPIITPDGRYVAFSSFATNLVTGRTNRCQAPEVYVRDLQAGVTTLVSVEGRNLYYDSTLSFLPDFARLAITPDGRLVAYTAFDRYSRFELLVRDLLLGKTTWVSTNIARGPGTRLTCSSQAVSDDGQFVVFKAESPSTNYVYRYDALAASLELISTNVARSGCGSVLDVWTTSGSDNYGPVMSSDGRYVAWVGAMASNSTSSVFLWDGQIKTNALVSLNVLGKPSTNGLFDAPAINPDGRYVAFLSNGTDLVTNGVNGEFQLYVRDMQSGVTELASADQAGQGAGSTESSAPCLTGDGRYVLFDSRTGAFASDARTNAYDVFLRDLVTGTTELISARPARVPGFTASGFSRIGPNSVSTDGRLVAFESFATDLIQGGAKGLPNVFLRDLVAGTNALVSVNRIGVASTSGASRVASISLDGRYALFSSTAGDLIANDTNRLEDVFVRDLVAGITILVSVNTNSQSANRAAWCASMSADARLVAFQSRATDLAAGISGTYDNVFVRDLVAGRTRSLTTGLPNVSTTTYTSPVLSPNGRFAAFQAFTGSTNTWLRDLQTDSTRMIGSNASALAFSGDSQTLAIICRAASSMPIQLLVLDLRTGSIRALNLGYPSSSEGISLSFGGNLVAFSTMGVLVGPDANMVEDVFVYSVPTGALSLISSNATGTGTGKGRSYWPRISVDGRYVAFRSTASDLVPSDANQADDIFLFDRSTRQRTLLSHSRFGPGPADGMSQGLVLSPDGTRVIFNSAGGDLIADDFNCAPDVFIATVQRTPPADTDQDGLDDAWEQAWFGDLGHDGSADTDGDGFKDAAEYRAGTNPLDPTSVLKIIDVATADETITIRWSGVTGRFYRIQYANTLDTPNWQDLGPIVIASWAEASINMPRGPTPEKRFYRVLLVDGH
jgi:Tol biopolymer transport system component